MILRYKSNWVKIDKNKWRKLSTKEKSKAISEYFLEQSKHIVDSVKKYFIGFAFVSIKELYEEKFYVYKATIFCGRYGKVFFFPFNNRNDLLEVLKKIDLCGDKKFIISQDLGGDYPMEYRLSKRQKKEISEELKKILEKEWYNNEVYFESKIGM